MMVTNQRFHQRLITNEYFYYVDWNVPYSANLHYCDYLIKLPFYTELISTNITNKFQLLKLIDLHMVSFVATVSISQ